MSEYVFLSLKLKWKIEHLLFPCYFSQLHTHTSQSRSGTTRRKEKDGGTRVEQEGIEVEHGMYVTYLKHLNENSLQN